MKTVALGQLAQVNPRGPRPSPESPVSFVGMAELDAESATARPLRTRPFSAVSKGYTVFYDRDILVAKITPCWENGKVGQADLDHPIGVGSTEFHVVRPGPDLDHRYLLHFLRQDTVRRSGELRMTGSAGQKRVPGQFLRTMGIPTPTLAEQKRIAAILDQADAIRTKRRQALVDLDSLEQSVFADLFGLVTQRARLKDLGVDFVSGKNVIGSDSMAHRSNRVIKVSAISRGIFVPSESKPMPMDYTPPESHRLRRGDVLFGRASGSLDLLGALAVVDVDTTDLFLPDKVWRLTTNPHSSFKTTYMMAVLRSPDARAFIRHNASGAAGVRNIGKAKILEYEAPVASDELQQQFAGRMKHIDAQRNRVRVALAADDELFASLQSRAFRGEL